MNDREECKLIILEGKVREVDIFEHMEKFFFRKEKIKYINLPAEQNIYMLWQKLKADEFQTDLVEILRESLPSAKKLLEGITRENIDEIYLFFDFDAQQNNLPQSKGVNIKDVVAEMLDTFNNETEAGKLYISYPMIESLRDFSGKGCSTHSGNCYIETANLSKYKHLSGANNPIADIKKYKIDDWQKILKIFAMRLSCLFTFPEIISYEKYRQTASPITIFEKELEWFKQGKTFILSAVPEFLLDYFKLSFWQSSIKGKKLNKQFCNRGNSIVANNSSNQK